MTPVTVTRSSITADLTRLGLTTGDHVLVHSSLSALGWVEGGADAAIDALLDAVGPTGTIVVPTLTGSEHVLAGGEVEFDPAWTPSWTGTIPETLRRREGAIRSLHPTHSVAALGAEAQTLTAGHEDTLTPCGTGSPFVRLGALSGRVLLLGVDHESNTTMHAIEELAGVPYHLQSGTVRGLVRLADSTIERSFWPHAYGTPRDFPAIEPLLEERGIQTHGTVGAALARLIDVAGLIDLGVALLRIDPDYLIKR